MKDILLFKEGNFIFTYKKSLYKYQISLIEVVVCDKPYLEFYIQNGFFLLKETIKSIIDKLPFSFIQISRKVVININCVKNITKTKNMHEIQMTNKRTYEISKRRYKKVVALVMEHYNKNMIIA